MASESFRARLARDPRYYDPQDFERDGDNGRFGHIDGTKIGQMWPSRRGLSEAGVHIPRKAGISGGPHTGSSSVVVSGAYRDDIDYGDVIYYTGAGGRDEDDMYGGPAEQSKDQDFHHPHNHALRASFERNRPVRVIRAVIQGGGKMYRYDGLYDVKSADLVKGESGYAICRFKLVRRKDQGDGGQ